MKRIIAIATVSVMVAGAALFSPNAYAGSARRHTIEGFMLGTGVAILGAAIIHEMNQDDRIIEKRVRAREYKHPKAVQYRQPGIQHSRKSKHYKKYAHNIRGHWEVRRIWNEPVYETRWNPGHYNKKGRWISGRYEKFMVKQGYWSENRVWVRH